MKPVLQQNSLNETGFKAYIDYLALKRHFSSSYDYHKYNGKVNASFESFVHRKDAFIFQKLGKQKDYHGLILSNLVKNPKIWVGSLSDPAAREVYLDWKQIQDSITNHVKDCLSVLDDEFQNNFIVRNGQYPLLVNLYLEKRISLDALCILVKLTNSKSYWEKEVIDKVIFPDIIRTIDKYHPFINYSSEKMKKIIKDHFF
jgi:hypothetical protein